MHASKAFSQGTRTVNMQEEEEAADAAAKGAKQAAGKKSRKPKKSAKKAAKTAAPSYADIAQAAAAAEQRATQHAADSGGAMHDPQPLSQPHANADDAPPPHARDEADDSWQLCPLTKVSYAIQQMSNAT
jgi:hypothetical protein